MANPLPADKSTAQTITVNGHTLHYTATVGTITLKSREDKPTGEVMYIAYTLDQPKGAPSRPVTFAVNGGPGASSVYLNLGRDRAEARGLCECGRFGLRSGDADG